MIYYLKLMRGRLLQFHTQQEKIDLLREASEKVFNYCFNYKKNRSKSHRLSNKPCRICGKTPTITHHIVQVQNGGMNISDNFIKLCELCHAQVHDWLLDNKVKEMNEKMDAECRLMVTVSE